MNKCMSRKYRTGALPECVHIVLICLAHLGLHITTPIFPIASLKVNYEKYAQFRNLQYPLLMRAELNANTTEALYHRLQYPTAVELLDTSPIVQAIPKYVTSTATFSVPSSLTIESCCFPPGSLCCRPLSSAIREYALHRAVLSTWDVSKPSVAKTSDRNLIKTNALAIHHGNITAKDVRLFAQVGARAMRCYLWKPKNLVTIATDQIYHCTVLIHTAHEE